MEFVTGIIIVWDVMEFLILELNSINAEFAAEITNVSGVMESRILGPDTMIVVSAMATIVVLCQKKIGKVMRIFP